MGTKELKDKRKFVDNGYVVEIINHGQKKVTITDVTVIFLQKKKKIAEASTEKIETHQPVIRYGNKNSLGYHFESIQQIKDTQSLLNGGENAIYWLSEDEVNYWLGLNPLLIFKISEPVRLKACVRLATGKQYYSSIIIHRSPDKEKRGANK